MRGPEETKDIILVGYIVLFCPSCSSLPSQSHSHRSFTGLPNCQFTLSLSLFQAATILPAAILPFLALCCVTAHSQSLTHTSLYLPSFLPSSVSVARSLPIETCPTYVLQGHVREERTAPIQSRPRWNEVNELLLYECTDGAGRSPLRLPTTPSSCLTCLASGSGPADRPVRC